MVLTSGSGGGTGQAGGWRGVRVRAQQSPRDPEPRDQGELRKREGQVVGGTCWGGEGQASLRGIIPASLLPGPNYEHKAHPSLGTKAGIQEA